MIKEYISSWLVNEVGLVGRSRDNIRSINFQKIGMLIGDLTQEDEELFSFVSETHLISAVEYLETNFNGLCDDNYACILTGYLPTYNAQTKEPRRLYEAIMEWDIIDLARFFFRSGNINSDLVEYVLSETPKVLLHYDVEAIRFENNEEKYNYINKLRRIIYYLRQNSQFKHNTCFMSNTTAILDALKPYHKDAYYYELKIKNTKYRHFHAI